MSRQIKFRAWDKESKEMLTVRNIDWGGLGENRTVAHIHVEEYSGEIPVGSIELMQWTGLKDVNGTEIYEGDVVEKILIENGKHITVCSFEPFVVKWLTCGFNLNFMKKHTCRVLGNFHEHPELLEGRNNE